MLCKNDGWGHPYPVEQVEARREVERRMQEEDNKLLLYVDPADTRFTL